MSFGSGPFLLNAVVIALAMIFILYVVAVRLAWAHQLHFLKIEAHRLRDDYAARLERAKRGERSEVELVGNDDVMIVDETTGKAA